MARVVAWSLRAPRRPASRDHRHEEMRVERPAGVDHVLAAVAVVPPLEFAVGHQPLLGGSDPAETFDRTLQMQGEVPAGRDVDRDPDLVQGGDLVVPVGIHQRVLPGHRQEVLDPFWPVAGEVGDELQETALRDAPPGGRTSGSCRRTPPRVRCRPSRSRPVRARRGGPVIPLSASLPGRQHPESSAVPSIAHRLASSSFFASRF
jgi:hypothetical protein